MVPAEGGAGMIIGDIEADCPLYRCVEPNHNCNECTWIQEYAKEMRKHDDNR